MVDVCITEEFKIMMDAYSLPYITDINIRRTILDNYLGGRSIEAPNMATSRMAAKFGGNLKKKDQKWPRGK